MKKHKNICDKIINFIYNLPIFDISEKTEKKLLIVWLIFAVAYIAFQAIRFIYIK